MRPEILFVTPRMPYPPTRGDTIRSWHVLSHLCGFARVHLAFFSQPGDAPADFAAMRAALGDGLGELHAEPMRRNYAAWVTRALLSRGPIGIAAYRSPGMRRFVDGLLERRPVAAIYAFSVHVAPYAPAAPGRRVIVDFVDFDSAKYADYIRAGATRLGLVSRWEANRLFAYEKEVAAAADVSLFVTDAEAALFRAHAGAGLGDVRTLPNGIDVDLFDPEGALPALGQRPDGALIVFTGQMGYPPNVLGVCEFAKQVMPLIRAVRPDARFVIVGRKPAEAVRALDGKDGRIVTGEVPDVRPWLAAASVVVAPLGIARGVQNKVLEAMAMARPVVSSGPAFEGIDAEPGRDLIVADGARAQADAVLALLGDEARAQALGQAARRRMVEGYGWDAQLAPLAAMLGLEARKAAA